MKFLLIFLAVFVIAKTGEANPNKSYKGYQVLSVEVKTNEDLEFLHSLTLKNEYDFWKLPRLGEKAQIMASVEELAKLQPVLVSKNIVSSVLVSDIDSLLATENLLRGPARQMSWNAYHTWATIEPWIVALEDNENADVTIVGRSSEGRPIYMVKVSTGPSSTGVPKKAIFLDASIHAREWIAVASATWVINELTTNPTPHAELLDAVDLYFIPMANPDGYVFTETERFWRKTRSVHPDPAEACRGADPNRNFEFMWGGESTSTDPCSDLFAGVAPWSEPEVRAIRDAMTTVQMGGQPIQGYTAIHACGNMWLLTWGFTAGIHSEDYSDILAWGQRVVHSIVAVFGTHYETGLGAEVLYGVGGSSYDHAKSVGIKYSATAEVRCGPGSGLDIFILPPEEIIPTAMEVLAGIKETGRTIVADPGKSTASSRSEIYTDNPC